MQAMTFGLKEFTASKPTHDWLKKIGIAFAPGPTTPLLQAVTGDLLDQFRQHGHQVQETPNADTDIILTTARFAEPLGWREALLFTARRRYNLSHTPR